MIVRGLPRARGVWKRGFSNSAARREIIDIESLPDRIIPRYPGNFLRGKEMRASLMLGRKSEQRPPVFAMALSPSKYPHNQER
jgi:hypothetical protein